jgi:hypothetical protein
MLSFAYGGSRLGIRPKGVDIAYNARLLTDPNYMPTFIRGLVKYSYAKRHADEILPDLPVPNIIPGSPGPSISPIQVCS